MLAVTREGGGWLSLGDVAVIRVVLGVERGGDAVVVAVERGGDVAVVAVERGRRVVTASGGGLWAVTWRSWVVSVSTSSPPGWPKNGR